MPGGRPKAELVLTDQETTELESLARRSRTAPQVARRARIVLACASGLDNKKVAQKTRVTPQTVGKWRARFVERRIDGLLDEPRPGAPRRIGDETIESVIVRTLESTPRGATHWSTREMAQAIGLSHMTVSRIWKAFGLQPHRTETFKLSPDPLLVEKVRDVVGLYVNPPEHAVVLCVDEKSQIQALERTQPILPMRPGQAERRSHDYRRAGTVSLFAALDVKTGNILSKIQPRHRAVEFKKFLELIDREVPQDLDVHLIVDNYSTHNTAAIRRWLAKRPRFHVHFTPTYSSWINLVERYFADLTSRQLRRGSHRSVRELKDAIQEHLDAHNDNPKPYIWTKTAAEIFSKVARAKQALESQH
jgi:transposase